MSKKEKIIEEINDLENYDHEVLLHENPFVLFNIYKNDIFMTSKTSVLKVSLNQLIELFIKENSNSKIQDVINEIEFKKADLKNIEKFSLYKYDSIRYAYASHFFDFTDLFYKGFIKDTSFDFKNDSIVNKYEFVFKNIGVNLKPIKEKNELMMSFDFSSFSLEELKEVKRIYNDAGVDFDIKSGSIKKDQKKKKEAPVKYFKIKKPDKNIKNKKYYIFKIKPKILKLNPGGRLGRIKQFQKSQSRSKIFSDPANNVRYFFITEKSFDYLDGVIYKSNEEVKFNKVKLHLDPTVYFHNYYDLREAFDKELFEYNLYEVSYKDVKNINFMKPDKIMSYFK